jgi:hypothetical protein
LLRAPAHAPFSVHGVPFIVVELGAEADPFLLHNFAAFGEM